MGPALKEFPVLCGRLKYKQILAMNCVMSLVQSTREGSRREMRWDIQMTVLVNIHILTYSTPPQGGGAFHQD